MTTKVTVKEIINKTVPSQCRQLCEILSIMVSSLGMPSVYVKFTGSGCSHWGIDIELVKGHWAFYDPSFFFCAKDPLPLSSKELKEKPEILEMWHRNFNQLSSYFRHSADGWAHGASEEDRSLALHFKQFLSYRKTEITSEESVKEYLKGTVHPQKFLK